MSDGISRKPQDESLSPFSPVESVREAIQPRQSLTPEANKNFVLGHEEDQRPADQNRFGNGSTTAEATKPGWVDLR